MATKTFLIFSVSALLVQCAVSQCMGRLGPYRSGLVDGLALDGPAWSGRVGCGGIAPAVDMTIASSLNAAYGGCLPITSSSAKAPTGLSVASENAYEGPVAVTGNLPFLGTADMEGVFPTSGASAISYGCGDGIVAITAESPIDATIAPAAIAPATIATAAIAPAGIAPTMDSWGYNGFPARGCGCGCGAPYGY